MKKQKKYIVSLLVVFLMAGTVNAASTIGTNMSTTGTFLVNPASNSVTSVRFQNAAGTNFFIADSTNMRIGIGGTPTTTFEVQGTASASYLLTANSLQVASALSTVSYSRFGTGTTGNGLTDIDDVLFTGLVEFDDNAFFDARASVALDFEVVGYASASIFYTYDGTESLPTYTFSNDLNSGMFSLGADDVGFTAGGVEFISLRNTAQDVITINDDGDDIDFIVDASGAANALVVEGSSGNVGVGTTAPATKFEVVGAASSSSGFVGYSLVVGNSAASNSTTYVAEFVSAATVSVLFQGTATNKGTCLQFQNTDGEAVYARIVGTTFTLNAISCN